MMVRMLAGVIAVLVVIRTGSAIAQNNAATLTGKVTDPSGTPISNVRVVVVEADRSVLTNGDGDYSLAVPGGLYTVRAQYIGFKPGEQDSVRLVVGASMRVDFQLQPAGGCDLDCDPLIVSVPDAAGTRQDPFLFFVNETSARLHLRSLSTASRGSPAELRVWFGFSLGGTDLLVLREGRGRWHGYFSHVAMGDDGGRLESLPDTTDWSELWRAMIAGGLLDLPTQPRRAPSNLVVMDGVAVVFESFDGTQYRVSEAAEPQAYCSPDDRRFIQVLAVFRPDYRSVQCP